MIKYDILCTKKEMRDPYVKIMDAGEMPDREEMKITA